MSELEQALVALGRELALPPAPDLAATVGGRLERRRRLRPWLVVALALLAAAAVALAVPQARSAILRFFHIRGAQVTLVDRLPAVSTRVRLGAPTTLERAPFRVLLPNGRRPDAVFAAPDGVWLRYANRLLVAEIRTGSPWFVKKVAGQGTTVRYLTVGGAPAIWIEGTPHDLFLPGGAVKLARNTLLWQRGELTLRLEGALDRKDAVRIALSFR
ncbi:MAG TPA: hypothetical protein VIU86_14250, partial [Gaiellaceae bacterium]